MDKVKRIFHCHRPSEIQPISQMPSEIPLLKDSWEGNLPCVHDPVDGCNNHNPRHHPVQFDPSLFSPDSTKHKPTTNVLDTVRTPDEYTIPTLSSALPQSPDLYCLTTIPRIHKSLPYTFSFYHLHWLLTHRRNGTLAHAHLQTLHCVAKTGQNPTLSWVTSPLVTDDGNLLLEYAMAFLVQADLGAWTPGSRGRAVAKHALIGSGYRDFKPCLHTTLAFTSHRGEGRDGVRTAGVAFTKGEDDGREVKGDWDSARDAGKDVEPLCCSKCYTETVLSFKLRGDQTLVSIQVYKNLGRGLHPGDPKWLALTKGIMVGRPKEDFLRMRREYEAMCET
ncbi:hypothetical protein C8A05DRAFT_31951 [Staphylotrichum tortipilum]|uniref:Uncharacterized protein n=1 Tax=Staphylotrichum tortipilum TaxID=2831512 RepID=A0AAN6MNN9_9PEZI|nr:hypothetical protein C8A05DRAFT_31951 [Staphylotrichum longicolle]